MKPANDNPIDIVELLTARGEYEELRNTVLEACKAWGEEHGRTPCDAAVILVGPIIVLLGADSDRDKRHATTALIQKLIMENAPAPEKGGMLTPARNGEAYDLPQELQRIAILAVETELWVEPTSEHCADFNVYERQGDALIEVFAGSSDDTIAFLFNEKGAR